MVQNIMADNSYNKDNSRIFVITHKQVCIPKIEGYFPLLVGAVNHPELKNAFLCDDEGDNISIKNDSYCELTLEFPQTAI